MVNELHLNFLKFFAIFGLAPYIRKRRRSQQQQRRRRHQRPCQHQYPPYPSHSYSHNVNYHVNHVCDFAVDFGPNQHLRWQQIYTGAIIILNLWLTLYGLVFSPFQDKTVISDLVSVIVFVIQMLVIYVVLIETALGYKEHFTFIGSIDKIQGLMQHLLQTQLCVDAIRHRQRRKYFLYICVVYGSLLAVMLVICFIRYSGYFWHAILAVLIIRTRCLQMLIALDYLCYYLELLNDKLKAVMSCKIERNYSILDVNYHHLESYEYMESFKMVYDEIYILHIIYNRIFGVSLVGILTVIVLDIIIHVYWSLLTIMNIYARYYLFITGGTLLPLCTIFFVLCYNGDRCEKRCNLILISLKSLLRTSSSKFSNPRNVTEYNSLLQAFIMQILHNPIRISANDYFTLNLKFVMAIAANMVTYIVILLQFRQNSSNLMPEDFNMTLNFTNDVCTNSSNFNNTWNNNLE
ncbi:putative gustatory receptor 39b [Musca vetustissima]|uniref:putative gustatory receptor 39b n=1 Tax=Musca vetustissima TaxID=27455 RepID=UPI002AB793F0|nr:putative gustatory receptor 39b [Musca vetustissima]